VNSQSMLDRKRRASDGKWLREKGAVLIEFALVLSIFLLLILGGMDLQRLANAKSNVDWIAQTLATCTKAGSCAGQNATTLAGGFSMDTKNISQVQKGAPPNAVTMTVTYNWQPISPFFPSGSQTVTSAATAP
jgi:hypothetical protein